MFCVGTAVLAFGIVWPSPGVGQQITSIWTNANPNNSNWSQEDPIGNWTTPNYPDNGRGGIDHWHAVIGAPPPALLNVDVTIDALTLTADGELSINAGRTLRVLETVTNDGLININPGGASATTTFHAADNLSLSGGGTLQLSRIGSFSRITVEPGKTITQHAGHTIAGVGQISGRLVNHGVIRADQSLGSGSVLELLIGEKVNLGLFEALAGSSLNLNGVPVPNDGATIRAAGPEALVRLSAGASVTGGTLETDDGGVFSASGTGTAGSLIDVTNEGIFEVAASSTLAARNGLTNNGLISINPGASSTTTTFHADNDLSLNGSGMLRLNRTGTASRITTEHASAITQQSGHKIAGVGQISGRLVNYGVIRADQSLGAGNSLELLMGEKVNLGLFEALAGSSLNLNGVPVPNDGATIRAAGPEALVRLSAGASVTGGTLETDDGGVFSTWGLGTAGSLIDVTNEGIFEVSGSSTLVVRNELTNHGLISINPARSSSTTSLHCQNDVTLSGSGTLQLNRSGTFSRITSEPDTTITQLPGHTISGVGQVSGRLVNHGIIRADQSLGAGNSLDLLIGEKVNLGLFEALAGSSLNLNGVPVTNDGAAIRAAGPEALVRLSAGASVTGGSLETDDGGVFSTWGLGTAGSLIDVTNQGIFEVSASSTLIVRDGLTNNGLISINPARSSSTTSFHCENDVTLSGSGILQLNRVGAFSRITTEPDTAITQQSGHTIAGVGQIAGTLFNHGTIHADASLGSGDILDLYQTTNTGLLLVESGATMRIPTGATVTNSPGGVLAGDGTLLVQGALNQLGSIAPGRGDFFRTLNVTGSITSHDTSILEIEIGGVDEVDRLHVSGAFNVDGKLQVVFLNGSESLSETDVLTIVTANSIDGAFSDVIAVTGGTFDVIYDTKEIRLTNFRDIVPHPLPATFAQWIAGEGVPPGRDGPGDDPNSNGHSNLASFFFGIPAMAPPPPGVLPVFRLHRDGSNMHIKFSSPRNVTGITVATEVGSTLGTWSPGPVVEWTGNTKTRRLYQVLIPLSEPRQFARLLFYLD